MVKAAAIDYIMDDPREAARLEAKVDPDAWVQRYMAHHIRPGMEVLSVGCGPGVILGAICALHPSVRGTGIDISPDRVTEAIRRNRDTPRTRCVWADAHATQLAAARHARCYCRSCAQSLTHNYQAA